LGVTGIPRPVFLGFSHVWGQKTVLGVAHVRWSPNFSLFNLLMPKNPGFLAMQRSSLFLAFPN
jgi:hypothetical protein